jgi:hypothetical protein
MSANKELFQIAFLIFCLTGCGFAQEIKIKNQVLSYPNLSPDTRKAIQEKTIKAGMTKEQVIASWGNPCWYCYGTRENSWGDTWEYNVFGSSSYGAGSGTYLYFDRSGYLEHWSK